MSSMPLSAKANKINKLLAIYLVILMIFAHAPQSVFAASESLTPQHGENKKFLAPIGAIEKNSIPISNREDLEKIGNDSEYPLDGIYHLTDNIDLSDAEWSPIGCKPTGDKIVQFEDMADWFTGVFDGQGYVIYNLAISDDYSFGGLFGIVSGAAVKNIGLEKTYIELERSDDLSFYVGGICGINSGSISNCYNEGNISVSISSSYSNSQYVNVGGICGSGKDIIAYSGGYGTVDYSYNTCDIYISTDFHESSFAVGGYAETMALLATATTQEMFQGI